MHPLRYIIFLLDWNSDTIQNFYEVDLNNKNYFNLLLR